MPSRAEARQKIADSGIKKKFIAEQLKLTRAGLDYHIMGEGNVDEDVWQRILNVLSSDKTILKFKRKSVTYPDGNSNNKKTEDFSSEYFEVSHERRALSTNLIFPFFSVGELGVLINVILLHGLSLDAIKSAATNFKRIPSSDPDCFCVEIPDDNNAPRIATGDLALFSPTASYSINDMIGLITTDKKLIIAKLVSNDDNFELQHLKEGSKSFTIELKDVHSSFILSQTIQDYRK